MSPISFLNYKPVHSESAYSELVYSAQNRESAWALVPRMSPKPTVVGCAEYTEHTDSEHTDSKYTGSKYTEDTGS